MFLSLIITARRQAAEEAKENAALLQELRDVDESLIAMREAVINSSRKTTLIARYLLREPLGWEPAPAISFRGRAWSVCEAAENAVIAFNQTVRRYQKVRDRATRDYPDNDLRLGETEINPGDLVQAECPVCHEPGHVLNPPPCPVHPAYRSQTALPGDPKPKPRETRV